MRDPDLGILITGETGTGKTRAAEFIHKNSPRAKSHFVNVCCNAIPADLIESRLFGHTKGAFTGASHDNPGLIRKAEGGTLLLDEVAETPLEIQLKLLDFIESKSFYPVGSNARVNADVRILGATNKNIQEAVKNGTFREDLYYRLNTFEIELEPLREQPRQIRKLATELLAGISSKKGTEKTLSFKAISALESYDFPGNIRELKRKLEVAFVLSGKGNIIEPLHLRIHEKTPIHAKDLVEQFIVANRGISNIPDTFERAAMFYAIETTKSHREAAQCLGLTLRQFTGRLDKFNMRGVTHKNVVETREPDHSA
ncbi:MAG: sigma 54-interacting transcriptional regulator [Alphaproteobacteria bacterium]